MLGARDDGGLIVAPIVGRTDEDELLGDRITRPGSYVAEHVALGYASTVHAAQGLTVDTSHTVVTSRTGHAALYVGLTRGRERNTAYACTRSVPADAPTGTVNQTLHRDPRAVLTAALEDAEPERSALATAGEAEEDVRSIKTPAELFADAAELATAGRTARWLDELTAEGKLTPQQRLELAAEDGGANLNRLLRRVELSGHDGRQVLTDAVTKRGLDDARQISNVIHHRISESVGLDPLGNRHTDWIPRVDDPAWQRYLADLARDADQRRAELGRQVAEQQPQWAVEALGPVPKEKAALDAWEERAGIVAAHRELTDHDDESTALGAAPKSGQVEAHASWRAAWRALGRPEADRDEAEISDGQLHMRVRAYEREQACAPPYVANELAGTSQAAQRHRATATLRAAEAETTNDDAGRAQLEQEAADAAQLADVLDARVEELKTVDEARALWWAHTAATRAAADRAAAELTARRAADERDDPLVTADRWTAERTDRADERADLAERQKAGLGHALSDDQAYVQADDKHRPVRDEHEFADVQAQHDTDRRALDKTAHPDAAETAVPDVREAAAREPRRDNDHDVRVPTSAETTDAVRRAQRALAELQARDHADRQRANEEVRVEQVARWHDERRDRAAVRDDPDDAALAH